MRSFLTAALVGAASAAALLDENDFKFVSFMTQHGKNYATSEEYTLRK